MHDFTSFCIWNVKFYRSLGPHPASDQSHPSLPSGCSCSFPRGEKKTTKTKPKRQNPALRLLKAQKAAPDGNTTKPLREAARRQNPRPRPRAPPRPPLRPRPRLGPIPARPAVPRCAGDPCRRREARAAGSRGRSAAGGSRARGVEGVPNMSHPKVHS